MKIPTWFQRGQLLALAIVVAAVMFLGAALEAITGDRVTASDPEAGGARFEVMGISCPPSVEERSTLLTATPSSGEDISLGVEPGDDPPYKLAAGSVFSHKVGDDAPRELVAYGDPAIAGATTISSRPQGVGAALCSEAASDRWYFAEGSSAAGYDQRILLYNPFPDEAVLSINFFTPSGRESRANLGDIAVPAGDFKIVKVNDFILRRRVLATYIEAARGRVVAWRQMFARPDDSAHGTSLSLGATRAAATWYFPDGSVGDGVTERISVLNPSSDSEAVVTVSLPTKKDPLQPPALREVAIPPETVKSFTLDEIVRGKQSDVGGVGAVVRSSEPVVVERMMSYQDDGGGVTAEVGASKAYRGVVVVPPVTTDVVADDLYILNPGSSNARVSVSLHFGDGSRSPGAMQDLKVRAGARIAVRLLFYSRRGMTIAVVTSDSPVVAERVAFGSNDAAAVIGTEWGPSTSVIPAQ